MDLSWRFVARHVPYKPIRKTRGKPPDPTYVTYVITHGTTNESFILSFEVDGEPLGQIGTFNSVSKAQEAADEHAESTIPASKWIKE